jgi:hypothetical protein
MTNTISSSGVVKPATMISGTTTIREDKWRIQDHPPFSQETVRLSNVLSVTMKFGHRWLTVDGGDAI